MRGTSHVIQAPTIKELERKTREWARRAWAVEGLQPHAARPCESHCPPLAGRFPAGHTA